MNKNTEDLVFKIGAAVGIYLLVAKPILDELGLADNDEVKYIEGLPPSQNPFSVMFGADGNDGEQLPLLSPDYIQQMLDYCAPNCSPDGIGENACPVVVPTNGNVCNMYYVAKTIYDSFSFLTDVDAGAVVAAFDNVLNKSDVAQIAGVFNYVYGQDLWNYIKRGYRVFGFFGSGGGLPSAVITQIVKRIQSLPDF